MKNKMKLSQSALFGEGGEVVVGGLLTEEARREIAERVQSLGDKFAENSFSLEELIHEADMMGRAYVWLLQEIINRLPEGFGVDTAVLLKTMGQVLHQTMILEDVQRQLGGG